MGDVKAGAQSHGHGHAGGSGSFDERVADRVQDNEATVAEHRNGNHPAH